MLDNRNVEHKTKRSCAKKFISRAEKQTNKQTDKTTKFWLSIYCNFFQVAVIYSVTRLIQDAGYVYMSFFLTDHLLFQKVSQQHDPFIKCKWKRQAKTSTELISKQQTNKYDSKRQRGIRTSTEWETKMKEGKQYSTLLQLITPRINVTYFNTHALTWFICHRKPWRTFLWFCWPADSVEQQSPNSWITSMEVRSVSLWYFKIYLICTKLHLNWSLKFPYNGRR